MQFEWNDKFFANEFDLVQAVYRANETELALKSTRAAASEIVTAMGHDPRATGMFAEKRMQDAMDAIDAARGNPITDRVLQIALAHQAAVKASFKGDKSEWAKAYVNSTKQFVDYLILINAGASVAAAETAVS